MIILKKAPLLLLFCSSLVYSMKGPKTIVKNTSTEPTAATLNLNALDEQGKAPLHYAVLRADYAEITSLLKQGASLSTKTADTGATVFHLAAETQNSTVTNTLLFFALLQQGDALIKAIADSTKDKPFALQTLQDRAIEVKKLLQAKNNNDQTACFFERVHNPASNEFGGQSPLLSAHKVHTDLQAFVAAIEAKTIKTLPQNNIYTAALMFEGK